MYLLHSIARSEPPPGKSGVGKGGGVELGTGKGGLLCARGKG